MLLVGRSLCLPAKCSYYRPRTPSWDAWGDRLVVCGPVLLGFVQNREKSVHPGVDPAANLVRTVHGLLIQSAAR